MAIHLLLAWPPPARPAGGSAAARGGGVLSHRIYVVVKAKLDLGSRFGISDATDVLLVGEVDGFKRPEDRADKAPFAHILFRVIAAVQEVNEDRSRGHGVFSLIDRLHQRSRCGRLGRRIRKTGKPFTAASGATNRKAVCALRNRLCRFWGLPRLPRGPTVAHRPGCEGDAAGGEKQRPVALFRSRKARPGRDTTTEMVNDAELWRPLPEEHLPPLATKPGDVIAVVAAVFDYGIGMSSPTLTSRRLFMAFAERVRIGWLHKPT
jgi:hypothetical protein